MTNEFLIKKAARYIKPKKMKDGLSADVSCALLSETGRVYVGVCVANGSNVICAERSAIAQMVAHGEYKIKKIVATWKDVDGNIFTISPCGNCRQFMREVDESNLKNTRIILDKNKTVLLQDLLPYYDWWKKQK